MTLVLPLLKILLIGLFWFCRLSLCAKFPRFYQEKIQHKCLNSFILGLYCESDVLESGLEKSVRKVAVKSDDIGGLGCSQPQNYVWAESSREDRESNRKTTQYGKNWETGLATVILLFHIPLQKIENPTSGGREYWSGMHSCNNIEMHWSDRLWYLWVSSSPCDLSSAWFSVCFRRV